MIDATSNTAAMQAFTKDLATYSALSGKTAAETLARQGDKLRFAMQRGMKRQAPKKGAIRSELEALGAVRVRPSIQNRVKRGRGGRNVRQEQVRREINARESAKGYLAYGFVMSDWRKGGFRSQLAKVEANKDTLHHAKGGFVSKISPSGKGNDRSLRLLSVAAEVGTIASKRGILSAAIAEVRADMGVYIERKQGEKAAQTFKGVYR